MSERSHPQTTITRITPLSKNSAQFVSLTDNFDDAHLLVSAVNYEVLR